MFTRTFKGAYGFYFFSGPTPRGIDDYPHGVDVQRRQGPTAK